MFNPRKKNLSEIHTLTPSANDRREFRTCTHGPKRAASDGFASELLPTPAGGFLDFCRRAIPKNSAVPVE